jgi:predicted lysophospholipase L1 biosynthesis ABC-type transport system permease subunit
VSPIHSFHPQLKKGTADGLVDSYMAAIAFIGVALVVPAVAILVIVVTHDSRRVVVLFLIEVAAFAVCFLLLYWVSKQMKREFAAGYTTSRMGYPNLEQVDEATGLIVRAAGEPLLSRQVRRDRVHAYKATRAGSREG